MTVIHADDGPPVRLAAPFDHIVVTYPFAWASPNRVHVEDERKGSGTVYSPEYARALAEAILAALDAGQRS